MKSFKVNMRDSVNGNEFGFTMVYRAVDAVQARTMAYVEFGHDVNNRKTEMQVISVDEVANA